MNKDCSENKHTPESPELFFEMVENARDGINITQGGVFRYVNKAFCDMVGYTRAELCGMSAADLLPQWSKERMMQQLSDCMNGIRKYSVDNTSLLHRSGTEIDIEFSVSPISYKGESASLITVRDIT